MAPSSASVLGLVSLLAFGCQVSAKASGEVNTSGADATAQASVKTESEERAGPPARSIEYKAGKLDYSGVINFEYDKADLLKDTDTEKTLRDFVTFLREHPDVSLEVEGHTDSRGSERYNAELSERRAQALRAWLIEQGIAEGRLTAVGKGESAPQVQEPEACHNKRPADPSSCEPIWSKNRRVVFSVTGGNEELEKEAAAPPPPPPPPPPVVEAPPPPKTCPWLVGGHLNALGPNSWVNGELAVQPGVCWLELGLGPGLGLGSRDVTVATQELEADYVSLTVPLRARIWFMDRHSLLGELGVGFTHYWLDADSEENGAGESLEYERNTTPLIGNLGLGYGFRPNGGQAGFRLAIVGGLLFHMTDLADSSINGDFAPAALGAAMQDALDDETDELAELEPYGEVSFGWLF